MARDWFRQAFTTRVLAGHANHELPEPLLLELLKAEPQLSPNFFFFFLPDLPFFFFVLPACAPPAGAACAAGAPAGWPYGGAAPAAG